jgi:hypothetical protein
MPNKKLIEKAKRKLKALQKLRKDPRYLKTIGKLKLAGLLDVRDIPEYRGQIFLEDAIWAAELEPRIYEILPAIIARRPRFFTFFQLPGDLDRAVKEIKRGNPVTSYQGVAPEKYNQWSSFVGRKTTAPKVMKAFRLGLEDLSLLKKLSDKTSKSQTEILSEALREYGRRI